MDRELTHDEAEQRIAELEGELALLRRELAGARDSSFTTSRRSLLRSAGLLGGLTALGATAGVAAAVPGSASPPADLDGVGGGDAAALVLNANGAQIQGDNPFANRQNTIHVVYFELGGEVPLHKKTTLPSDRRRYPPLMFRKPVDKGSPFLWRAFALAQDCDGRFQFFRPSPSGDGSTEQYFTVEFDQARIVGVKLLNLDSAAGAPRGNVGQFEEIALSCRSLTWTFTNGGLTFSDTWGSTD